MNELDVVALKADRPDLGLKAGEAGTIVMKFTDTDFLVEFSDDEGQEYAMPTLRAEDLSLVWTVDGGDVEGAVSRLRRAG